MPPKKKPEQTNVARLSTEEQVGYLFHQFEDFADWRIKVDERLNQNEDALNGLTTEVGNLRGEVRESIHLSKENNVLLREVKIFLQGQQTPGLERPGVSDDLRKLREDAQKDREKTQHDYDALSKKQEKYDSMLARIGWIMIGFGGVTGAGGIAFWPKIIKIIDLLK